MFHMLGTTMTMQLMAISLQQWHTHPFNSLISKTTIKANHFELE